MPHILMCGGPQFTLRHTSGSRQPLVTRQQPILPDRNLSNNLPIFSHLISQTCHFHQIFGNSLNLASAVHAGNHRVSFSQKLCFTHQAVVMFKLRRSDTRNLSFERQVVVISGRTSKPNVDPDNDEIQSQLFHPAIASALSPEELCPTDLKIRQVV